MVLEFGKLEYHVELEFCENWAIKKNNVVLELGILEYHATQYSSIPGSSTFYKKIKNKKKINLHSTRVW